MGTDVPSFLANDRSIPKYREGTGWTAIPDVGGPYPKLHRKTSHNDESTDDSEVYYSASSFNTSTTPLKHSPKNNGKSSALTGPATNSALTGPSPNSKSSPKNAQKPVPAKLNTNLNQYKSSGPKSSGGHNSTTPHTGQHHSGSGAHKSHTNSSNGHSNNSNVNGTSGHSSGGGNSSSGHSSGGHTSGHSGSGHSGSGHSNGGHSSGGHSSGSHNSGGFHSGHPSNGSNEHRSSNPVIISPTSSPVVSSPGVGSPGLSSPGISSPNGSKRTSQPPVSAVDPSTLPWDTKDASAWTNERVIWWLNVNGFNNQWKEKFKEFDIHGDSFFELISYAAVKKLGVSESPSRFVTLLRAIVPPSLKENRTRSVTRSSTLQAPGAGGAGNTGETKSGYAEGDSSSKSLLVGARRTSIEKFLFLATQMRPHREISPGPSILISTDGKNFQLVEVDGVENGHDLRSRVWKVLTGNEKPTRNNGLLDVESTEMPETVPPAVQIQLTDYFCVPGNPLNDEHLWMIMCAAAGDIVKFHVELKSPEGSPMWSGSEESLSPPLNPWNNTRTYPRTPAYLQGQSYFSLQHPSTATPMQLHAQQLDIKKRKGSTEKRRPSNGSERRNSSTEQLVALRAAPKPPLARSLSSKYRPELSPTAPSSPDDEDTWGDIPDLSDEEEEGDELWAKPPKTATQASTPPDNKIQQQQQKRQQKPNQPAQQQQQPVRPTLNISLSSANVNRIQEVSESEETSPRGDKHLSAHSDASVESPRSPGTALLEQSSIDWAARPPAEVLYENLEQFFPNTDLDKPAPNDANGANPAGNQNTSTSEESNANTSVNSDRSPGSRSVSNSSISSANTSNMFRSAYSDASQSFEDAPLDGPPPLPSKSSISRAKSIRHVAREASKRLTNQSSLDRRSSTKMWGQKVVELREGTANLVTLRDNKHYVWIRGEMIGRGSFGKVYLGLNATTGDMMAVKQVQAPRIHPIYAGNAKNAKKTAEDTMRALNAEVENMKDLDHLNIVQYLGFEKLDRVSNLFLEYVPGGSVKTLLIKYGRFPEPTIRYLTKQILAGLSYLHTRGILHRDLKADNLLLDINGTIKISDFGISKRSRDIYNNNAEMSMQGTIFWMAPEVIHNVVKNQKQGYSAKVDVWSLGCVILEMFVGRRPWSTEEAIGAMYKLGSSRQAPPIPEDANVSEVGKNFLDLCFTIDAKERPMAHELQNHAFCTVDPHYRFAATKLGIELRKSAKQASLMLRTKTDARRWHEAKKEAAKRETPREPPRETPREAMRETARENARREKR